MTKFFVKNSVIILLLITSISAYSQSECRSILGAHLTPVGKTPFSWAIEETAAFGFMSDRTIGNNLLFTGLDFTKKTHTVYFEGGFKGWKNSLGATGKGNNHGSGFDLGSFGPFQQSRLGVREAYYNYRKNTFNLIIGLHTTQLDDYFLVDERAIGIDYKQSFGALSVNANVSTVLDDFVRMGNFCTVKYIYNTIKGHSDPYIGNAFGETNFSSIVISWKPSEKGTWKKENDADFDEFKSIDEKDEFKSFEEDEFKSVDEDDEFKSIEDKEFKEIEPKKSQFDFSNMINSYGLIIYEEFGDSVPDIKNYFGAMISLEFPYKFKLKIEVLNQLITNQNTVGYYINLNKNINWKAGLSSLNITYAGKYEITENTNFYAAYSNLFMGEVMRMDLWDMPLIGFEAKHSFKSKLKPYLKIKAVQQLTPINTGALDFESGFQFLKHCKFTGIFSKIHSDLLPEKTNYLVRFELRVAF